MGGMCVGYGECKIWEYSTIKVMSETRKERKHCRYSTIVRSGKNGGWLCVWEGMVGVGMCVVETLA